MKANLPFCVAVEFSFDSVRALHATRIITLKPKGEAISAFVIFFALPHFPFTFFLSVKKVNYI